MTSAKVNSQEPWKSRFGRIALGTAVFGALIGASGLASASWFDWRIGRAHVGGLLFQGLPSAVLLGVTAMPFYKMCGSPSEKEPARRVGALLGVVALWVSWMCVANRFENYGLGLWAFGTGLLLSVSWFASRPTLHLFALQASFITAIPALGMLGAFLGRVLRRAIF